MQIKMVGLQEPPQQLVAAEQALRAVLVQLEIQLVHQRDLCLAMVHIYKVALLVVWRILKAAAAVVVVTTAAVAVLIKLGQSMAEAVAARAT